MSVKIAEKLASENIAEYIVHMCQTEDLINLHLLLLKEDIVYQKVYDEAKGNINNQILLSKKTIRDPVRICLNGIYGMLLLRLNGMTISSDQSTMLTAFGKVLAYLSNAYKNVTLS